MNWFDVMRRLEQDDAQAFDELRGLVRGQLARMRAARGIANAEDVVQDALVGLLRAWRAGRITAVEQFAGFAWRLTQRRLADAWGQQARNAAPPAAGEDEPNPVGVTGADESSVGALEMRRALEKLDPALRHALCAIYFEGLSYREAAQGLDVPFGTFKRRLSLGLRHLRAELV